MSDDGSEPLLSGEETDATRRYASSAGSAPEKSMQSKVSISSHRSLVSAALSAQVT